MLETITINIVCNIASSILFSFIILHSLRPKIEISDVISKQRNTFENQPSQVYVFKIINKSRFSAFDVQLELFKVEQYRATARGNSYRIKPLKLKVSEIKHIPPFRTSQFCSITGQAPHCTLFRTSENLETIFLRENESLQLQITLRHGLTGLSRVYQKEYVNLHKIKNGSFKFGNSFELENN